MTSMDRKRPQTKKNTQIHWPSFLGDQQDVIEEEEVDVFLGLATKGNTTSAFCDKLV